jgi:hypothetical protein
MGESIPKNLFALLTRNIANEGLRDHLECEKRCQQILNELKTEADIDFVSRHETGHFIHTVALGLHVNFPLAEIKMHPPAVEYEDGEFSYNLGYVYSPFDHKKQPWTVDIIELLADIAVAGEVYTDSKRGTQWDINHFHDYYRDALQALHDTPGFYEANDFLETAKITVKNRIPKFDSKAKQQSAHYKATELRLFLDYIRSDGSLDIQKS